MAAPLQILVYDRQQKVYQDTFTGPVDLGRQRDGKEVLYSCRREGERSRVVIARLDEDTVSRDHACIEPLPNNKARIKNSSAKVSIRLADNSELRAGAETEVTLPTVIALGRKTIRIQQSDGREAPIRGLAEATAPPGAMSMGPRFPTLDGIKSVLIQPGGAPSAAPNAQAQMEEVIRWLQTTMEVLHLAASSSDFFQKAAQAAVDIVGLDRARVLLLEKDEWKTEASWMSPKVVNRAEWRISQQVLNKVRQEKRTFWLAPEEEDMDSSGSLIGVEVVVASPILNPQGDIIGAIYADARQESYAAAPKVTRIEAIIVELLARGVAVGLARMESERVAIAARVQFEQFFTRELSQQLAREPNLLEGRDCEVTLLFSDIRGFSRISERLGPEGTVRWVSQVMGTLTDCVMKHQGVLVDYIGDELLAMWGAPVVQPDHAQLACLAALDMVGSLPALNERWGAILGEPLSIGIGLNTGVARVGNTGSAQKFKYGPLGNPVNLASRVQGATKYLKCPLLLTQYTKAKLDERFQTRKLCSVRVINIQQPVELYELAPADRPRWVELKTKYEEALQQFTESNHRQAARTLGNLFGEFPDDGPSLVLMSRAVSALVGGQDPQHPVWDLPGK